MRGLIALAGCATLLFAVSAAVAGERMAAPKATITAHPPSLSDASTADFSFSSTDMSAGFECALDDEMFTACTSPTHYMGLPDGARTFQVRAIEKSLVGKPATYRWVVDTQPPDTQIVKHPASPTPSTTATFTFNSPTDKKGVVFHCEHDSGFVTQCKSPVTYRNLARGMAHTFSVRAVDAVGHEDPTPATATWNIS